MWIAISAMVLYTIISVYWFLHCMGDKFRDSPWYDYVLLLPAMGIAYTIGAVRWAHGVLTRRKS